MMVEHGTDDHKGRSYKVWAMKTGAKSPWQGGIRATPILVEDYLRKEMSDTNRPQIDDKLNKPNRPLCFAKPTWTLRQYGNVERKHNRKTMQQPKHTNTDQPGETKQSGNSEKMSKNWKSKHKVKKH